MLYRVSYEDFSLCDISRDNIDNRKIMYYSIPKLLYYNNYQQILIRYDNFYQVIIRRVDNK